MMMPTCTSACTYIVHGHDIMLCTVGYQGYTLVDVHVQVDVNVLCTYVYMYKHVQTFYKRTCTLNTCTLNTHKFVQGCCVQVISQL